MGVLYTLFIGIPACLLLCTAGVLLMATILGIPVGLTCIALGFKMLTIQKRPKVVVKGPLSR